MFNSKNKSLPAFLMVFILILAACTTKPDGERSGNDRQTPPAAEDQETNSNASKKEPAEKEAVERKPYIGELELPVEGATGYTSVALELKASANPDAKTIETMKAGTAFEIIREEGGWWFIKRGPSSGWLPHQYCFINLPDVIPSIVYDNTNTYSSKFVSSGKAIPTISNRALYPGKTFNERLGKEEYIMPVLYKMSKKIHNAQQHALKKGDSLKIYEAFRPLMVQMAVVDGLSELAKKDPNVMAGINTPPWDITWFITNGVSNHQKGYAIDVSLVKVNGKKEVPIGDYTVSMITDYTEYEMPTPIHELSGASAIFTAPVPSRSATAWKNAAYSDSMNEAAMKLQTYCTSAGLSPLASEWWHFNDLEAMNEIADNPGEGKFILNESHSSSPD
ncbi:M15 family metallopeptidase [Bacillus sp. FJAT-27445]|uniref:M15 family metallopeptidase n=1 Tax=Bacillus sp. FJAT-27445 TaxID=1679166 RepID=UPI000743B4F9|nr:M15 family metallopeptidase [Bacillus sp. FJAT-27445]